MSNFKQKITEAVEHINKAQKHLKTGLFNWKPDYESAALEYNEAALLFRNGKSLEQSASAYIKCAEMRKANKDMFHSAKALEEAAKLYRDLGDYSKTADLVEEACGLYIEYGSIDTARIALERVAKMLESNMPERAIKLFIKTCDVAEAQDNISVAAEMLGYAARNAVKIKKLDEAAKALSQQVVLFGKFDHHGLLNKTAIYSVLVQIARTDYVAADKALQDCIKCDSVLAESAEASLSQKLIEAYDKSDYELAVQVLNNHIIKNLDNDYVLLANNLKLPNAPKKDNDAGDSKNCDTNDDDIDLR